MIRQPVNLAGGLFVAVVLWAAPTDGPVAAAAQRGDLEAVRTLLKQGADVNAAQADGMTALHWAAQSGNVPMLRVLLSAGASTAAITRLGWYTPLHLASREGHAEAIRMLLQGGARVDAVTSTGAAPIHLAADGGRPEAVQALLDHGADVNAKDAFADRTPLMFAVAKGRLEAAKVLINAGADLRAATRVVDYAERSKADDAELRKRARVLAAARGPLPDTTQATGGGRRGAAPVARDTASASRDTAAARPGESPGRGYASPPSSERRAAVRPQDEPDSPDSTRRAATRALTYEDWVGRQGGMTALHYAARDGRLDAARLLLEAGAEINQQTLGDHSTPLLVAVINGHYDLAIELLRRGADPRLASEDGATPLFAAINCEWALRTWHPQPTAWQQQKTTYLDLMEALLTAGADPNARLNTHLWYAAYNAGRMGVDYSGATAFWRAAYALDVAAMKLLVKYGADPNIPTIKPPEGRFPGAANRSRDSTEREEKDPSGLPPVPVGGPAVHPLIAASGVGYGTSRVGQQHRHVPDGWLPAVKYLVDELKVDVNVRDHDGYNAVHNAAARGDNEMILYLVSKGADVMAVSRRGQTTVDMANGPQQRVQPFPETIALLESMGARNNHRCQSCD
ncbi:MAG TPA: ankyrin repeat domain-containing protein [Gemmatimonadales bacterium]|nr:ankyrin repeat domain-containing protein [Gemmatimonadales bacterium]